MSKTSTYFITVASLLLLLLTGCAENNNEPVTPTGNMCPGFTATIEESSSRAFNQSWEENDEIGISGAGRTNVCYHTEAGNGDFSVKTSGDQIYFQDDNAVDFTAYYPWNELSDGVTTISADTRDQTLQKNFDFLWAKASGKKDAPTVNFSFTHRMTKVVFTVKPGDNMSFDEIKNARLSLSGFRHTGSFNIADGTTETTADTETWVFSQYMVVNETDKTLTFSLIFFPQVFSNPLDFNAVIEMPDNNQLSLQAVIDFTSSNRVLDGANARNEWVSGRQYNLILTLHRTEISMGQTGILTWNNVTPGDDIIVD